MFSPDRVQRSLLQRRSSISHSLQTLFDGATVLGIAYYLILLRVGAVTAEYTIFVLLLIGAMAVIYDHYGIYRSNANFTRKAFNLFKAWTLTFAILLVIGFLSKQSVTFSRLLVGELYVAGYLAQLCLHYAMRAVQQRFLRRAQADQVVIVGTDRLARYLHQKISQNPWLGQEVVGCVALSSTDTPAEAGAPVLGTLAQLPRLIEQHRVRTVYFAIPLDASDVLEDLYFNLLDKHVAVHWVPDIFSLRLVNHSVREIAGLPVITLSETPLTGTRLALKSLEDGLLSCIILLLIAPVLLAVALAVKLDSPGPVFFRQPRNGWSGRTFHIWKFRSMYVHPVEQGVVKQAQKNDPRITRVGRFIRRTSLDELPQLFNVLKGEMSLVGPRPHAVQHDAEYSQRISDYFARLNIKPGITGLAQVRGHRGETRDIHEMIQRVESDIEYINNWSLWLDISILFRTIGAFTGSKAY
jgi:putative colanic acid biosynthesis UDP-glucose lipid carrier transferase